MLRPTLELPAQPVLSHFYHNNPPEVILKWFLRSTTMLETSVYKLIFYAVCNLLYKLQPMTDKAFGLHPCWGGVM